MDKHEGITNCGNKLQGCSLLPGLLNRLRGGMRQRDRISGLFKLRQDGLSIKPCIGLFTARERDFQINPGSDSAFVRSK